jgi:hypothetical protein
MSFFKKIFGQKESPESKLPTNLPPAASVQQLLEMYGGIVLEKQRNFEELIGDRSWQFEMATGEIAFGDDLHFPVQILGTWSSGTWLAAWANDKSGIPGSLLEHTFLLKKYGQENNIDLLRISTFEGDKNEGFIISMIASGLFESGCFYAADYGDGIMFVTIDASYLNYSSADSHQKAFASFSQLISIFHVNHKRAFRNYLKAKGYEITEEGTVVYGMKDRFVIIGEFDEGDRLVNLKG